MSIIETITHLQENYEKYFWDTAALGSNEIRLGERGSSIIEFGYNEADGNYYVIRNIEEPKRFDRKPYHSESVEGKRLKEFIQALQPKLKDPGFRMNQASDYPRQLEATEKFINEFKY